MARSNPFGNRTSAVGQAANAFARQGQSVSQARVSAQNFVSGRGAAPSTPANPRASSNQGLAQRPTGQSAPGRSSGTSELRINPRRAEKINNQQMQNHAQAIFENARRAHADISARVNAFSSEDKQLLDLLPKNEFGMIDFGESNGFGAVKGIANLSEQKLGELRQKAGLFNQKQLLARGPAAPLTPAGDRALAELRMLADGVGLEKLSDDELLRFSGISGANGQPGALGFNPQANIPLFDPRTGSIQEAPKDNVLDSGYASRKAKEAVDRHKINNSTVPGYLDPMVLDAVWSKAFSEAQQEQNSVIAQENIASQRRSEFDASRPGTGQFFDVGQGGSNVSGRSVAGGSPEDIAQTSNEFFSSGGGSQGMPGFGADSLRNEQMALQASLADAFDDENLNIKVYESGRQDARDAYARRLEFEDELNDFARKRTQENERRSLEENKFARERLSLQKSQQSMQIRRQNVESEMRNRRTAAKLGINFDTGGLQWMQEEIRKGEETLQFLELNYALGDKELASQRINIINEYELRMQEHDLNARQAYGQAFSDYQKSISSLQSEFYSSQKDVRTARKEARERYADKVYEIDKATAEFYTEERRRAEDREFELAKHEMDNMIKNGDALSFIDSTASRIEGNSVIKRGREAIQFYDIVEESGNRAETLLANNAGDRQYVAVDNALVTGFMKMTDPGSVVRESEFNRIPDGIGLVEGIRAKWAGWQYGGILTPESRREIVEMSRLLKEAHMENVQIELQPFIDRVDRFNRQSGSFEAVEITDLIPAAILPDLPQTTVDMWTIQMRGGEAHFGGEGALPQFNVDAVGMRTDRHNNPTALAWSPRLEKWFNDRGHKVTKGDPFPDNANAFTLDFSKEKDVYAATRDYIDHHTFYYNGAQRWTHTALSKNDWDSMSIAQKNQVISNMYAKEGGNGSLAINTIQNTPIAEHKNEGFDIIQKAYSQDVPEEIPANQPAMEPSQMLALLPNSSLGEEDFDVSGMLTHKDLSAIRNSSPESRQKVIDQIIKVKLGQIEAKGIYVPRDPGIVAKATAATVQAINDSSLLTMGKGSERAKIVWSAGKFLFQKSADLIKDVSFALSQ